MRSVDASSCVCLVCMALGGEISAGVVRAELRLPRLHNHIERMLAYRSWLTSALTYSSEDNLELEFKSLLNIRGLDNIPQGHQGSVMKYYANWSHSICTLLPSFYIIQRLTRLDLNFNPVYLLPSFYIIQRLTKLDLNFNPVYLLPPFYYPRSSYAS
jgi:hypothetical protein